MSARTKQIWKELQTDAGSNSTGNARRRIHEDSPHDLWLAIDLATRQRQLIHYRNNVAGPTPELPQWRAVSSQNRALAGNAIQTTVTLLDDDFAEVFTTLVDDVSAAAAGAGDQDSAASALSSRLWHWKHLLESLRDSGLSPEARRGLAGELMVLTHLMDSGVKLSHLIRGWTGPYGSNQDLQIADNAVEIKTSSGRQPSNLSIASERQLDDTGLRVLHLIHTSLDERVGGTGLSLNQIVDRLAVVARAHPPTDAELADRLNQAGYLQLQRSLYDEPRYTVRSLATYRVTGSFPRITEPLPKGVGNVRYDIAISACAPYEVLATSLVDHLLQAIQES